jgi:hypothetical protein
MRGSVWYRVVIAMAVVWASTVAAQQATPIRRASTAMAPAGGPARGGGSADAGTALVREYCTTCHNERLKAGGLSLLDFDVGAATARIAVAEKMIRKVRAGMMPPPGMKRPDEATLKAFALGLETRIDHAAAAKPRAGWRPFQRLNRVEYARAVRDLLGLEIDPSAFLPPDTVSHGFDNISDEQTFSPALMEGYLRAASQISRLGLGDRHASAGSVTYKVARDASQMRQVEGAPVGTRGGISVVHTFVADGEYAFRMLLHSGPTGDLFGGASRGEQIEVSIDGERAALVPIKHTMRESDPNGLNVFTPRIHVKAGSRRVSAAFIQNGDGPIDDLISPIEHTLADTNIGETFGVTAPPHLREFAITGPHVVTGVSETPTRRRVFTCRPTSPDDEGPCARQIIGRLAAEAYRGRATDEDLADLQRLYAQARAKDGFEAGIRLALQAILANPRFLFRVEQTPAATGAGQTYRVSDLDLASRLSFFLWGTMPDAELIKTARSGLLGKPGMLDRQVSRMLADARAEALATRFASQWLRLQDVSKTRPDTLTYPHWDNTLSEAFVRETELLFETIVREDRNVLELLTADYTFVNERLAKHYRIPNVMGNDFRRVRIPDEHRRGILGQGSVLLLTSVADRTSPVLRGKWIMEVLLGTPPPPPPPNVPDLEETKGVKGARLLSVRERLEEHRANPACNSCHRVIDPLGLALENYDATGAWRVKDNGVAVDATGELYDGTKLDGPQGLRAALLKRSDVILLSFTESLMTYALGRHIEYEDMPTVRAIAREASANGNRVSSFISGIVKSAAFQMSTADSPVTER